MYVNSLFYPRNGPIMRVVLRLLLRPKDDVLDVLAKDDVIYEEPFISSKWTGYAGCPSALASTSLAI